MKLQQQKLQNLLMRCLKKRQEYLFITYPISMQRISIMSPLTNLLDISVVDTEECEQMWLLIIDAIDNLEQVTRARELTNIIWDINLKSSKTEQDWRRTEILLESYQRARDEALESALANLRELVEIMNDSNIPKS